MGTGGVRPQLGRPRLDHDHRSTARGGGCGLRRKAPEPEEEIAGERAAEVRDVGDLVVEVDRAEKVQRQEASTKVRA